MKSAVFEQLCDENRSGGLGKSSKEVSESTVDEDEESRERFRSKNGSGSGVGKGGRQVTVWSCAAVAAGTQAEAEATCVGAAPPLCKQAEMAARDEVMLLGGSAVAVTGEVRAGREGVGGS